MHRVYKKDIVKPMDITLKRSVLKGKISVATSKSETIRALLVASFAKENSVVSDILESLDTQACLKACRAFGATITYINDNNVRIIPPKAYPQVITVDCENSGTTLYLATSLAASIGNKVTFTGDKQLINRPVRELLNALVSLGAKIEYLQKEGYPPFSIQGPLKGGHCSIASHTSQYLSSLLLGAPLAEGDVEIEVPLLNEKPYVEMTESYLKMQNIKYSSVEMKHYVIRGNQNYKGFKKQIPGDWSSASFFFCAAAITKGQITVDNLDSNDFQGDKEILNILEKMGCKISYDGNSITLTAPKGTLQGGYFDLNDIPDTLPVLAVTAAFAKGKTTLANVPQARIKETDRIKVMHDNLKICQAEVTEGSDYLEIYGKGFLEGAIVSGYDDHRVIMAMAVASLATKSPLTIKGIDAVKVTFPTFFSQLEKICYPIKEKRDENI